MAEDITGGCSCGQVRYRGAILDGSAFRCYCRDCQQATGTGHSEMLALMVETATFNGLLREHQFTSDAGRPTWAGFCPECGSPISRRSQVMQDRIYVHAASLDDPTMYQPKRSIYAASAQPWDQPTK